MPTHSGLLRLSSEFGSQGSDVTPSGSDVTLGARVRYVVVTSKGNLVIVPLDNDDADSITFAQAPVGFVPPFKVKKIINSGTSASVASII